MTRRQFTGEEVASVLIETGIIPLIGREVTSSSGTNIPRQRKFGMSAFRFTERSAPARFET